MKGVIVFLVVVAVAIGAVGWYLDWFKFQKTGNSHEINLNVNVDKDKVKKDVNESVDKAKEKAEELRDKLKGSSPAGGAKSKGDGEERKQ